MATKKIQDMTDKQLSDYGQQIQQELKPLLQLRSDIIQEQFNRRRAVPSPLIPLGKVPSKPTSSGK
jgi:hypothetical protein